MAKRDIAEQCERRRRSRWIARAGSGALLSVGLMAIAGNVFSDGISDRTVLQVGAVSFSVGQVQARMAQVPAFQLRSLGATDTQLRKNFVNQLAAGEIMAEGARANGMEERTDVNDRIRAVLRSALLADLRSEASRDDVTAEDVRAFYEANKQQYQSPLRIKIWQILVKTKEEADALLNTIQTDESFKKDAMAAWEKLAREQSMDKSTAMRRGNLGFVEPDGSTAHRDVSVDPAFYKAAMTVKDGETVTAPVEVKGGWAVVQRRGSHGPVSRTLQMEAMTIRNMLAKKRMQARVNNLLAQLRGKYVPEQHDAHVDKLEMTPEGELGSKRRPGTLQRKPRAARGSGRPHGHPGHMR